MNGVELIRRLHQHRAWVNHKLIDAAGSVTAEDLRKVFPIGQGSVFKSLTHLYAAEYVWLECLLGNEDPLVPGDLPGKIPGNQDGEGAAGSLDELNSRWHQLETRWQAYLETLNDAALDRVAYKVSTRDQKRHATRCADILLHVCTHAQYTTAQVINMLRHMGAKALPDPMLISLAREETPSG